MALDPVTLEARIHLRVCELKVLAAWTAVNWTGERKKFANSRNPRGLPPPPACRDDEPDEA